jgi:hypothetical protein
VAESLLALGRLHGAAGRKADATGELVEALAIGQELDWPHTVVLAACSLAWLARGDVKFAEERLAAHEDRLCHRARMEARLLLFKATEDPTHLAAARDLLDALLENAPRDCRDAMREEVPLHREILAVG